MSISIKKVTQAIKGITTHTYYESISNTKVYTVIGKVKKITPNGECLFSKSKEFGSLQRTLTLKLQKGLPISKPKLMTQFKVPGRLYNLALNMAQGAIDSAKECSKLELERTEERILRKLVEYSEAVTLGKDKELKGREDHIRKLLREETKYTKRLENPTVFYGRKYYEDQDRKDWKEDYVNFRNNTLGFMGSKDETGGNTIKLKHKYTNVDTKHEIFEIKYAGKVVGEVAFKGKEGKDLVNILGENNKPFTFEKVKNKYKLKQGIEEYTLRKNSQGRTPLTVIFRKIRSKWYIYISYSKEYVKPVGLTNTLGVDLNIDSIAYALIKDIKDKPITTTLKFSRKGSSERTAELANYVRDVVNIAKINKAIVVLEYLDFEESKKHLKNKLGALLHVMPYKKIRELFERRCLEAGVELRYVNPRYTSILGGVISERFGDLNRDEAAATIIALRGSAIGNDWLEEQCKALLRSKSFRVRVNSKGKFGLNVKLNSKTTNCLMDKDVASTQWLLGCVISKVTKTLNSEHRRDVRLSRGLDFSVGRNTIDVSYPAVVGAPHPHQETP